MDKTYSDLMDIVNRTKKIDEIEGVSKPKTTRVIKPASFNESETEEEGKLKPSLFAGREAISRFMEAKSKPKAKAKPKETKNSTTKAGAKKTATKKSTSKKSTTKKTTAKKSPSKNAKATKAIGDIKEKLGAIKATNVVKKSEPKLNLDNPKDRELYNVLHSTLLAGGTDISDYIDEDEKTKTKSMLNTLAKKRRANELNQDITKEQQEYEKLFTGSFYGEEDTSTPDYKIIEENQIKAENNELEEALFRMQERDKADQISDVESNENNEAKNVEALDEAKDEGIAIDENESHDFKGDRFNKDLEEMKIRDSAMDAKIAEYYKRKEAKLAEYNAEQTSESEDTPKTSEYDSKKHEYEDIFSGPIVSREEIKPRQEQTTIIKEEPKEDIKKDNSTEFTNLYNNLNSEDANDDGTQFVTPESEVIDTQLDKSEMHNPNPIIDEVMGIEDFEYDFEKEEYKNEENNVKETFTDDELVNNEINEFDDAEMEEPNEEIDDNIYDLSGNDVNLDDYIVSSNLPQESIAKDEEDAPADNERFMEIDDLPESKINVLGQKIKDTEKVDEVSDESKANESDAISKEEFYNEMARLQENLLNELKNPIQKPTETIEPVVDHENANSTLDKALDIINHLTQKSIHDNENNDEKAHTVVDDIINHLESKNQDEQSNFVDSNDQENDKNKTNDESDSSEAKADEKVDKVEPDLSQIVLDNENLLKKDVALNESDLEYIVNSEKPREVKDDCFYLSPEDKETRDEFLTVYADNGSVKEVGDINLNKDIQNAIPNVAKENNPDKLSKVDDMETIYTLFGTQRKKMEKEKEDIKVLYLASECQPFVATGGLADVAGSLPKAIAKIGGVDIRVMLPLYGNIKKEYRDKMEYIGNFTVHLSWRQEYCGLFKYIDSGVTYYFIDNERYFKREKLYGYYDDGERFAYFCKAVVESLPLINYFPEIIHCNDWQSALVSTFIKTGNWSDYRYYKIKNVYTIHNVEYQGVYGMENLKDLFGIDYRFKNDLEYNGEINLTKAAIQYSDKFTTVSDSYCDNLKQPYCSRGLHHIIIRNEYKLCGIINGIDYDFYNPKTDKNLYKNYDENSIYDKVANKKLWQDELGLPVDGRTPMLAIVSRLVSHKGIDLLAKILENVLQNDIQLVVVGTGDQRFIDYFKYLESKYPTKVRAMVDKFSNELARKAYGASDIFLMPSKIEPCGISQMIASKYGSIPIVREVGGLRDTIKDFGCEDGGNGYTFSSYNPNDLLDRINQALSDYKNPEEWEKKMKVCMAQDFSWDKSAQKYIDQYKSLVN